MTTRYGPCIRCLFGVTLALLLSGCAFSGEAIQRGTEVADTAVDAALFTLCRAATIGSIRRRFGNSEEQLAAYAVLCEEGSDVTPAIRQ